MNQVAPVPLPVSGSTGAERLELAAWLWGWFPHDGQRELFGAAGQGGEVEPRTLVAVCGRRWGKTEALGCDMAARVLLEPDLGQLAVAPTRDQAAGLFDCVREKIEAALANPDALDRFPHLADLRVRESPYPHIRRVSDGATVLAACSAYKGGRNLRGKGTTRTIRRFRVIIDERAWVDDEAVSRVLRPMLATSPGGGQLVEIGSPAGTQGDFYRDYLRGQEGKPGWRSIRLPSRQNPLVDEDYLAEMQETLPPLVYRAEFEAEFVDAAGAVFADADIKACVTSDDYGDAALPGIRYVAGVDWGRRTDWTVCVVCAVSSAGCRVVALHRLRSLGYGAQVEQVAGVLEKWNVRVACADRTGVGDAVCDQLQETLNEQQTRCWLDPFVFTQASKAEIVDTLVLALARRTVAFPAYPDLVGELGAFTATPTSGGGETLAARRGAHDDCVCALALALRAARPFLPTRNAGGVRAQVWRNNNTENDDARHSGECEGKVDFAWHGGRGTSRISLRARWVNWWATAGLPLVFRSEGARRAVAQVPKWWRGFRRGRSG